MEMQHDDNGESLQAQGKAAEDGQEKNGEEEMKRLGIE
jgi:hypothetical protein